MNLIETLSHEKPNQEASHRIFGVVVGVVSNINDPDSLGRVKVKFPWLKADDESQWARIMSFMAGKDRGAVFRPEVDDEVLVLFEHGDMRFPYVIGSLWNGKDSIPSERGTDSDNNVRLIKSRSGHKIILDDTSGSEKVTVEDKNGNVVEMSSSGVVIKSDAVKIGDGAGEALVLGTAFMDLYNNHTHNTGVGPSSPPVSLMADGTHISSKHKTL